MSQNFKTRNLNKIATALALPAGLLLSIASGIHARPQNASVPIAGAPQVAAAVQAPVTAGAQGATPAAQAVPPEAAEAPRSCT